MSDSVSGAPSGASPAERCEVCGRGLVSPPDYATLLQPGECARGADIWRNWMQIECYRLGYERLLAILEQYPCPHSRPSWRMCPHCLGINRPVPSDGWVAAAPEAPSK